MLVCGWVQDLFFFELLGDLHRAAAFHAEIKDVPGDLRGFLINDPLQSRFCWTKNWPCLALRAEPQSTFQVVRIDHFSICDNDKLL